MRHGELLKGLTDGIESGRVRVNGPRDATRPDLGAVYARDGELVRGEKTIHVSNDTAGDQRQRSPEVVFKRGEAGTEGGRYVDLVGRRRDVDERTIEIQQHGPGRWIPWGVRRRVRLRWEGSGIRHGP